MKSCLTQRRLRPSKKSACGLCKPHQRGWAGKHTIADQRAATAHEQQLSDAATAARARIKSVAFQPEYLCVTLDDGRIIQAPLSWYPTLFHATKTQLKTWKPCGAGRGIHWSLLDYHLSIEGLLRGAHEAEGVTRRTLAEA